MFFLSRAVLLSCVCFVVECDLLDLYVQHMDETMRTTAYQKTHVKNLGRARNKRSTVESSHVVNEDFLHKFGNFKKQKLELPEDWESELKAKGKGNKKHFIEKDDGLDSENKREENLDPSHHEMMKEDTLNEMKFPKHWMLDHKHKTKDRGFENDGLDFENKREEHLDPSQHELVEKEATNDMKFPKDWMLDLKHKTKDNPHASHYEMMEKEATNTRPDLKHKAKDNRVFINKDDGFNNANANEANEGDFELIRPTDDNLPQSTPQTYSVHELDLEQTFHQNPDSEAFDMNANNKSVSGISTEMNDGEEVDEEYAMEGPEVEITTESSNVEDMNLDVEIIDESDADEAPREADGPSIKRNPKTLRRVPKKYNPSEKDFKLLRKLMNKESILRHVSAGNVTRMKRSVKEPTFTRQEELDDDGNVLLEWDPSDEDVVTFRVTAKTLGYVEIGFNEKDHMKGADILLAWVDDHTGAVNLLDSHGIEESNANPVTDVSQDVEILEGSQNDTHTRITFSRKWETCDPHDHQLTGDTVRVIWALPNTDPEFDTPAWHGERRGGCALRLKGPAPHPPPQPSNDSEIRQWDVKLNQFAVSNESSTVYWCKIFKAPSLSGKHHMIGYTPLVEKANEDLVHHIILYECASTSPILGGQSRLTGAHCYSPNIPKEWDSCVQPIVAWARGSKGEWLPEHVGIPIAEGSHYKLEVHYNNPSLKEKVIDSSGVRLYHTQKLRPQEAGILVTGVAVNALHMIPPRRKEFATVGYCTSHCTDTMFPKDGINILSVTLHSHLAGRRLGLKHIRQGKELPRIVQDNHFDFNYQQSHTLEREVKVLPGDELVAECVYGTLDRAQHTLGGYAASQEMCLAFIVHYPRTPLAACMTITPAEDLFRALGVSSFKAHTMDNLQKIFLTSKTNTIVLPPITQEPVYPADGNNETAPRAMRYFTGVNENDDVFARLVIKEPTEFRGLTLAEHILALPWTDELLARSIERNLYHGSHMTFCRKRNNELIEPVDIETFPNFTALPEVNDTGCSALRKSALSSSSGVLITTPALIAATFGILHWRHLIRF